jgi:WD40 repeat protein
MYRAKSGVLFERRDSSLETKEKNYKNEVNNNFNEEPKIIQHFLYIANEEAQKFEKEIKETNKEEKPLSFSVGRSFGGWFGIGTSDSRIALWKIQKTVNLEQLSTVLPRTVCVLDEFWENPNTKKSKVSSSLVFEDKFLLIRGYENGDIIVSSIPSGSEDDEFVFENSHTKRVNCLWRPEKTSNLKNIFLSTGSDCLVKVWDLETKTLQCNFYQHTAPVTHILGPPERKASERRWQKIIIFFFSFFFI